MTAEHSTTETRRPLAGRISGPRKLLGAVVLLAVGYVFFLLQSGRLETFEIDGPSMEPTLEQGDRLFVQRMNDEPIDYWQLVIFHNPTPLLTEELLIKRVVGLPGDHVEIISGSVYINGAPCMEPLLGQVRIPDTVDRDITLEDDKIYVLGDNWANSHDSSEFGPLDINAVMGRARFRYWPLSRLGYVN